MNLITRGKPLGRSGKDFQNLLWVKNIFSCKTLFSLACSSVSVEFPWFQFVPYFKCNPCLWFSLLLSLVSSSSINIFSTPKNNYLKFYYTMTVLCPTKRFVYPSWFRKRNSRILSGGVPPPTFHHIISFRLPCGALLIPASSGHSSMRSILCIRRYN